MRLTLHTDYALRTLIYLGLRQDRRVSIREIAEAHRISENHLIKVVHNLGRGGEVVRFTEEDMALVACFQAPGEGGGCALLNICRLQSLLGEALGAFLAVLDSRTLADLLPDQDRAAMAARLGILAPPEPI
jgi:Rrf2 family nitric oxide-sensitive transcriptional repressor